MDMGERGRLIAICGIDGSGKTVQTELLCRRARQAGVTVQTMEFPRYQGGFFGELIARYLRGEFAKDPAAVNPYLVALPFACDRWQAAPILHGWLAEGALVVCNRYVPANLAHQGAKIESPAERSEFLKWVDELEYEVFGLPRADLHVWLDMAVQIASDLVSKKHPRKYLRQERDIHENSMSHLTATREVYSELAAQGPDWLTVHCAAGGHALPPEQIAQKLWAGVSRLLEKTG